MARGLKFWIEEVERLYYSCSEHKGADQLLCYREGDLRLCFRIYMPKSQFSHNEAHIAEEQVVAYLEIIKLYFFCLFLHKHI